MDSAAGSNCGSSGNSDSTSTTAEACSNEGAVFSSVFKSAVVFTASAVLALIDTVLSSALTLSAVLVSIESVEPDDTGLDAIGSEDMVVPGTFAKISSMGKGRNANRRKIHISSACIGVLASFTPSRAWTTIS